MYSSGIGLGMETMAFIYMAFFFHIGHGYCLIFGCSLLSLRMKGTQDEKTKRRRDEKMKKTMKEMDYQVIVA